MTFTKSYTTRRSQPMIRSRLRRPTSKSTMAVLCPRRARPVPMAALVVVLPTPPLPEVTTRILAKVIYPKYLKIKAFLSWNGGLSNAFLVLENWPQYPLKAGDVQHVSRQADLYRLAPQRVAAQVLGGLVLAGDGEHLGAHLLAEDPRPGIAFHAGQGTPPQGTVHMDVAIGEKFRAGTDRRHHHQVAALGVDLLAAA